MSYILEALRRAEAERRRGQAPALQQVAAPLGAAPDPASGAASRRTLAVAGLALAALAAAAAWWWLGRPGPEPARGAATVPIAPPPASAPVLVQMPPSPPPPAAVPMPAAAPVVPPPPAVATTPAPPPRLVAPAPLPAAAKPRTVKAAEPVRTPTASASAPAARAIAASALPEPQRSAVARLAFGGAVHSQDRAQSFVLVGGQIVHEGAALAPGIVLERIGPHTLLLRVEGQAVEVSL